MEPVYHYVRGRGWIINADTDSTVEIEGVLYRVECRFPQPGEHYMMDTKFVYGGSEWFYTKSTKSGKPKMKKWRSVRKLSGFPKMDEDSYNYYQRNTYNNRERYHWCTLVPM